jgi:DNA-binding CsgD family transcriptional regulator/tetratricopeptide (TPR) repeat protein
VSTDAGTGTTVGREPELARLDAALDALADGTPGFLAVEGDPGIGKTRLLDELRRRAEERDCLVLAGAAAEFERELPYSVWVDALDAYAASQEDELREQCEAGLVDELAAVLPSLRRAGGAAHDTVADERYRAHRAMRGLLEHLASERPLVLALDDLHWTDDASAELIAALLRRGTRAPILLALAFRPGQAPARLSAALAAPGTERLWLDPLTDGEATQLLAGLDAAAAASILRDAGGNPFYLQQLARGGPQAGGPRDAAGTAGVPAAVAASIAEELGSLAPAERRMLESAAVAGEPFEPDLAAAIADLSPADGLAALDALLAVDLVRPTAVPRRFAFRHPLVRRAVYESSRGGWRLSAHARAAAALAGRGGGDAERAHHVEQSAAPGDEQGIAVLLAAGDASATRAPAAAARWYEAALRLLPASDASRQIEVRVALASALRSTGELDRCRATLLEAVDLLAPDDVERRVELTAWCAAVEHWQGNHDEAHRRLTRAWESLPDRSGTAAVALGIELAVDGLYELDFEQTLSMGRAALQTARGIGDRALLASAASALCLGEAAAGEIAPAREHLAEALAVVDDLSDAELGSRLEALFYLGWAENYLERFDEAIAHADRGIAIARTIGEGRLLVPLMLTKGYPFEAQGRVADAVAVCEEAVEAARLAGNPHYLFWALFELGFALYYRGDLDGAIAAGEESQRIGRRAAGGTIPAAGGGPGWLTANARFLAGDVQRAREEMHALGSDELEHKIPVERCFDWEILTLVEIAVGDLEAADGYARRAEAHAEHLGLDLPRSLGERSRAAVLLAQGEPDRAAQAAARSAALASGIGAGLVAAFARGLQGQALAAAGRRDEAVAVLRGAEADLDRYGAERARDELRRDLRRLGARTEVRGRAAAGDSGVASLTKRELEIAELVTDRRTNREIAQALFLSDKTVESHLRNIFAKLGVSSRVDVARLVERERS